MAAWDVSRISSDSDVVPPADCMDLNCSGSNSGNLISIGRYWGLGITPGGPESKALLKRWVDWGNAHRRILHADLLHLKRPDGSGYDAMMHVDAEPPPLTLSTNSSVHYDVEPVERALLMVFNQSPRRLNTTLTVPLYFAGLSSATKVTRGFLGPNGHPVDTPDSKVWQLRRDWTVRLPIAVEPSGIAWYIFTGTV